MADTLNISPDEKIAGVPLARLLRNLDETSYNEGALDLACRLSDCKAVIEALLSARAATKAAAPADAPILEALRLFMSASFPVCTSINPRGYSWCTPCLDAARAAGLKAMEGRAPAEDAREEVQDDLLKRLRIMAGMITMGEQIAWGSDSALMLEAANFIERRASSVPAIPGTLDEAAAYRQWRDCELSEDAWFMQHLSDYLPAGRAPTAAEWDAAMLRVMQDRAANAAEAKAGVDVPSA